MPEPTYKIAQRLLASRAAVGVKQYGDDLTANSPGCMLVHALEEAADQVNYLLAEIQRRREAIRILLDTAERLTQWNDVNLNEDARQLVRVIDLLGGESALAQYDEILGGGTVAENATVDPRDEALRVATEALQSVANHITNAGGVQMDAEPRYRFLTTGQNELIQTVFSALAAIRAQSHAALKTEGVKEEEL